MGAEVVKDNQWWFSKSNLRPHVENAPFIELVIAGRSCPLQRSAHGTNGAPTFSFKFLRDDDLQFWKTLKGQEVEIDVIESLQESPQIDEDEEDDFPEYSVERRSQQDLNLETALEESAMPAACRSDTRTIFDAYIFVDWSANNRPKTGKDSIWIAEAWFEDHDLVWQAGERGCVNSRTREMAYNHLLRRLTDHVEKNRRTLICFDFAYSYPHCAEATAFSASFQQLWQRLSEAIEDNDRNQSNRFAVADKLNALVDCPSGEGPFWGKPTTGGPAELQILKSTKPMNWKKRNGLKEFRVVEERLRSQGNRPFSTWQLFGNGSVGSQVLTGVPRAHSLRKAPRLCDCSAVWPFETGWRNAFDEKTKIVHAEFWPGAIAMDTSLHPVRDAAQVLSCTAWAAQQDACGKLGQYFNPLEKNDPDREIAAQEGWILGVLG